MTKHYSIILGHQRIQISFSEDDDLQTKTLGLQWHMKKGSFTFKAPTMLRAKIKGN
jgi:hypothetical protein